MKHLLIAILFFLIAFGALVFIEGCMDPLPQRGIDTVEVGDDDVGAPHRQTGGENPGAGNDIYAD
jgi:hypothetical protein